MAKRKPPIDSLSSKPRPASVPAALAPRPKKGDSEEWRAMLLLTNTEKDALEEFSERVRKATRYRPTLSEIVRVLIDAQLSTLKQSDVGQLQAYIDEAGGRGASEHVERWLGDQIAPRR